jgi:hypothetical protein
MVSLMRQATKGRAKNGANDGSEDGDPEAKE